MSLERKFAGSYLKRFSSIIREDSFSSSSRPVMPGCDAWESPGHFEATLGSSLGTKLILTVAQSRGLLTLDSFCFKSIDLG